MSKNPSTRLWRWAAIVYAVMVVVVSSWPGVKLPNIGEGNLDKFLHLIQYAVLGYLCARGWGPQRQPESHGIVAWIAAIVLLIFAAVDEYHQRWIVGRVAEMGDWVADALGIALGYLIGSIMNRMQTSRSRADSIRTDSPSMSEGGPS